MTGEGLALQSEQMPWLGPGDGLESDALVEAHEPALMGHRQSEQIQIRELTGSENP